MKYCLFLFCLIVSNLNALEVKPKPSFVLLSREVGMFSVFFEVLSLVQSYEKGQFSSVEVNFGKTGLYYSPKHGPNWWEYYFEPISLGPPPTQATDLIVGFELYINPRDIASRTPRTTCHALITKYVHIKPHIQSKIEAFISENFENHFIIGVHYRGTDKYRESPRVKYDKVIAELDQEIAKQQTNSYKIFVATDEAQFLDYIKSIYPDKICYYEDAFRSRNGTPVHSRSKDPYARGEEAILDCVLLSRTDLLLRTSSNLSIASGFFNPDLTIIDIKNDN